MSHIQSSQREPPPLHRSTCSPPSEAAIPASRFSSSAPAELGNRPYFPRHASDLPLAELWILYRQFYDERTAPKLILTSEELPGAAWCPKPSPCGPTWRGNFHARRGEKRDIMERALANAREQLGRRLAEQAQTSCWKAWPICSGWTSRRRIEVTTIPIFKAPCPGAFIVAGPMASRKRNTASSTSSPPT